MLGICLLLLVTPPDITSLSSKLCPGDSSACPVTLRKLSRGAVDSPGTFSSPAQKLPWAGASLSPVLALADDTAIAHTLRCDVKLHGGPKA